jgi:hypothetical protein
MTSNTSWKQPPFTFSSVPTWTIFCSSALAIYVTYWARHSSATNISTFWWIRWVFFLLIGLPVHYTPFLLLTQCVISPSGLCCIGIRLWLLLYSSFVYQNSVSCLLHLLCRDDIPFSPKSLIFLSFVVIAGIDLSLVLPLALLNYWKERALIIIELLGNFFFLFFSFLYSKPPASPCCYLHTRSCSTPEFPIICTYFLYPNNSFVWYLFTILQTHRQSDWSY